ncbi:MAG: hypothetical protein SGPRY_011563, partial [Prymnesium sp.]
RSKQGQLLRSGVAKRLHKGASYLSFSRREGVGQRTASIDAAPEHLRVDLVRAIGSKGRLDAPGEKQPTRASVRVSVRETHAALVARVQQELLGVSTRQRGRPHVSHTSGGAQAGVAEAGQIKVSEFVTVSRLLLGSAVPDRGSLDELREAWTLMS